MTLERIVVIGAGGFGREVAAWVVAAARAGAPWELAGFVDDRLDALGHHPGRILGTTAEYEPRSDDRLVCAIGVPAVRRRVYELFTARGGRFATVIHPTALVADRAVLGEGVVVCPYAIISVDSRVEDGAAVYYHSSVDHDAVVGRWSQISAHCDVTGAAVLEDEVFLGSHASVLPGVRVGRGAVVGAGAIVTTDVPAGETVVGVPARTVSR
jgi:sugar O-acyltransferase (sialic acid O-acetyltransferase NeuD family)